MTPSDRLQHILSSTLFHRLKSDQPDFESKIHVIHGDISQPDIGIIPEDQQILFSCVSVVFHLAATVNFNEPLRAAVNLNILGLRRVMDLCKQMTKLEALVHVSTAYANCDKENISEMVYQPPLAPQKILDAMDWMTDDILNEITTRVISPRPNTYTFTKAIAEDMLLQEPIERESG